MNFIESEKFLLNLKVNEGYSSGGQHITLIKKTKKTLYLSNNKIIHIKKMNNFFYLDAKQNSINQILRDIDGYLIYKKLTKNNFITW